VRIDLSFLLYLIGDNLCGYIIAIIINWYYYYYYYYYYIDTLKQTNMESKKTRWKNSYHHWGWRGGLYHLQ
jgi:hypothetical protein